MPGAWAHSLYWQTQTVEPPATGASANNGYVPWMTTVTIGSLFGPLQMMGVILAQLRKKDR